MTWIFRPAELYAQNARRAHYAKIERNSDARHSRI